MYRSQYGRQRIYADDVQSVTNVLISDFLTQGPTVSHFEAALARQCGVRYVVAVCNGTAALHLAYLAAGLKKGDEVIVPAMTFVATTNMLLAVGAKPVFCDIRADTYNIDETKIERLITARTKAIVPVHMCGHPCDMATIRTIARKRKLMVIADGAHALGATYHGKPNASYADMTTFSFHPVKTITTGEGGAIVTNDTRLYERLKLLRTHGVTKDNNGFIAMSALGFNYRITDIQCALGLSQLQKLQQFNRTRRAIVQWYHKKLCDIDQIILPVELPSIRSSWHLYVIRTKKKADRLPLYHYLLKHGIGVNFHYPAVYRHPYYRAHGWRHFSLPECERYSDTAITLPLHVHLTKNDIQSVASAIKYYFGRLKK